MILEEETYKKFGYWPNELSRCSHRRIIAKCDNCGLIRENAYYAYRKLCFKCTMNSEEVRKKMSEAHRGEKNHNFGKHFSEEHKQKIRETRLGKKLSSETKDKISKTLIGRFVGEKNPNYGNHYSEEIRKKMRDNHRDYRGENHPNWKGGISFEPYCINFDDEIKEMIREQYGRKCFICDKSETENGRRLDVHHIDYNKNQGCNEIDWKLVPLCISCHMKTNANREYWKKIIFNKLKSNEENNE